MLINLTRNSFGGQLKSLNDGSFCDSVAMSVDLVVKMVPKEEVEFYDDEKHEPESEL